MATQNKFDGVISEVLANYRPGFSLRPFQMEVLEYLYDTRDSAIVSAPTGAGKSAIFHLAGRVLARRTGVSSSHITLVLTPLNIIQTDQVKTLTKLGMSACRLDIGGHASCHQYPMMSESGESSDDEDDGLESSESSDDEDNEAHSETKVGEYL